jgi:hypothetical protein
MAQSEFRPMKHFSFAVLVATSLLAFFTIDAQTPATKTDEQDVLTLVKEVQAQQAQIVANQTKIDSKLTDLAETIRVARIFSSRSGGHSK